MAGLINAAEATQIRKALGAFLVHTATYTPVSSTGAVDQHGEDTTTTGDPVQIACKYRASDRIRIDEGGVVLVRRPTLKVVVNSPVTTGGTITEIRNSQNVLLAAGPLTVGQMLNSDGFGVTLQRRYELRGGDPMQQGGA